VIKYDFDRVIYRKPNNYRTDKEIEFVYGFDSETLTDGAPFMFAVSDGTVFKPKDIPVKLFARKYRNGNFGVWNLKFDAGSILYHLPTDSKTELRETGQTIHGPYKYRWIPHKFLSISKGKNAVTFWDINTFFKMSLDRAGEKYIGERKQDIETKTFTPKYVKSNWSRIAKYCLQDAALVAKLYDYFRKGLNEIDVHPKNLYSCASIAHHYFTLNSRINDVWRFWTNYKEMLRYACESYNGGKFEIYTRGRFEGAMYDINSAYPHAIANLYDIKRATVYRSKEYDPDAVYGFIRCFIDNTAALHVPVARKYGPNNIYPAGKFNATITKQEYDYLIELGLPVKIHSAYWLLLQSKRRPYKNVIDDLYAKKSLFKGKDPRQYMLTKIIMNGFYGKMIQLVEDHKGQVKAGACFNPVHASVITAACRIQVSRICNEYPGRVHAVHTDSVIMNDTLPGHYMGSDLGLWSAEGQGQGVLIASGIYQLAGKSKFRGIEIKDGLSWMDLLNKHPRNKYISIPQQVVMSWVESNFRAKDYLTNRFTVKIKDIDLNCDSKRVWPGDVTGRALVSSSQKSLPRILLERAHR